MSQEFGNIPYPMQSSAQASWKMVGWKTVKLWVDDAFLEDIMEILVDENFDEGSMELELDPQDDPDDENIGD